MIIQSPKELSIGSIIRYGENQCVGMIDSDGKYQKLFAMVVLSETTQEEFIQDLKRIEISPEQLERSTKYSQILGARFYKVSVD